MSSIVVIYLVSGHVKRFFGLIWVLLCIEIAMLSLVRKVTYMPLSLEMSGK